MPMQRLVLDDFSGGINSRTDPHQRGPGTWQALFGMVLESDGALRTQWAQQQIGDDVRDLAPTDTGRTVTWLRLLAALSNYFLVMRTDGPGGIHYWWVKMPTSAVDDPTTQALTWTRLATLDDEDLEDVAIVTVPRDVVSGTGIGHQSGLLLHQGRGGSNTDAVVLYEISPATLGVEAYTNFYPTSTSVDAVPRAKYGTMWDDRLVLAGGVEYADDEGVAFGAGNASEYRNYLWLSEAGNVVRYDPQGVYAVGTPRGQIVGVFPTDAGLLVFKDEHIGVWLLRGTASSFTVEPLHSGVAATKHICFWGHTNTVCWVDATGQVWQTNGSDVLRLDNDALPWDRPDSTWDIEAMGPYLLVGRDNQLFCLAAFGDDTASWTELQPISPALGITGLQANGDQTYYGSGTTVGRFNRREAGVSWVRGDLPNSGQVSAFVESGPISDLIDGRTHDRVHFHRLGMRAYLRGGTQRHAYLEMQDRSYYTDVSEADWYWEVGTWDDQLTGRTELVGRAPGPMDQGRVYADLIGDWELYDFTVWYAAAAERRMAGRT